MNLSVTMRDLLQAGVHFGHRARYWNPKMAPYIYGMRNKIHIIDLEKTREALEEALDFVYDTCTNPSARIMFVGTKRAAGSIIKEQAIRAGMPYVNHRWLGGMLTNYKTIRSSIRHLQDLQIQSEDGTFDKLTKKEGLLRQAEMRKLERNIGGIKDMPGLPDALFVVDVTHEHIAISEARHLGMPVIGIVDTNSDPDLVDYVIPGNDDAIRAISLYIKMVSDVCLMARKATAPDVDEAASESAKESAAAEVKSNEASAVVAEETPAEEVVAEEASAEEIPVEKVAAEEVPAEEAPAEEVAAEEVPAEEAPAEEVAAGEADSEEADVEKSS